MKIKVWLIKKLGGYTKQEYDIALKQNFIQELETRVRQGDTVIIGVRNMGIFNSIVQLFNKDVVEINRQRATIKYNDITFRVLNITNVHEIHKLRGINLNGFFFIDWKWD